LRLTIPPAAEGCIVDTPLPAAEPASVGLNPGALDRLSAALQGEIVSGLLPGAVALIARHGRLAYFEAFGRQAPGQAAAMDRGTIFRIYSMTKPIVSVAALMLVEEGRLLLNDPVSVYLPEFERTRVGVERDGQLDLEPARTPITVQDLLRHTAGMTYAFLGDNAVQRLCAHAQLGSQQRSNAQLCAVLAELPLMLQPGSAFSYSHATDVLGRVIEVITGRPLGRVLSERILAPLEMVDTGFHVPAAQHARIAEPFANDPQGDAAVQLIDVHTAHPLESGGGGLVSTASDYARFLQCLLDGGTRAGVRLLGRKTLEFMSHDHLGTLPAVGDTLPPGHGFGLGFAVRLAAGLAPMPGSTGTLHWGGVAGTSFFIDPAERLLAVLMVQAPYQRVRCRTLFRQLVYAALDG
jgi:CubicO group peptidase (beta-lactamase class C family)